MDICCDSIGAIGDAAESKNGNIGVYALKHN
jgi:hypothetical protein